MTDLPPGFTFCPWCPASGPPVFMEGHMKRHEDENAIAQMVALQGRIQDWNICVEIADERVRQDDKWGEQNHPDGTGVDWLAMITPAFGSRMEEVDPELISKLAKNTCERYALKGQLTFLHIALEEIAEAFAETDEQALRAELVQAAAVLVNWIGAIDRRKRNDEENVEVVDPS